MNEELKAIPYHASIRLRLTHFKQLKDTKGDLIGREVKCEVKKNKVAPPMRNMTYTIHWGGKPGAWIDEAETMWDGGIRSEVLKKVSAQKYMFTYSSGEQVEFTKKVFKNLVDEDENFVNEFKDALAKSYIITSDNLLESEIIIEDAPDDEGLE